jgi:hypothetical protein
MSNQDSQIILSESSINSVPELSKHKQYLFRYIYIALTITNTIIGYYLIFNKDYYFMNKYNEIILYIYIYTHIWPFALVSAIILFLLLSAIYRLLLHFKVVTKVAVIEEAGVLGILYICFTALLSLMYVIAIPVGIQYIGIISSDDSFRDIKRYFLIYVFFIGNSVIGILLIGIVLYTIICVRFGVSQKQRLILNKEEMDDIEIEIKNAQRNSGIYDRQTTAKTHIPRENI